MVETEVRKGGAASVPGKGGSSKKAAAGKKKAASSGSGKAAAAGKGKKQKAGRARKTEAASPGKSARGEKAVEELFGRGDQVVSIFSKGLDLVEAGIGLGINLVGRFGGIAQEQVVERIAGVVRRAGTHDAGVVQEAGSAHGDEPAAGGEVAAPRGSVHVVNRLPLFQGSPVKISFSINNNSPSSSKTLRLGVEVFVGEVHRFELDPKAFSVRPSKKTIAPMDFEKFVLVGTIADEVPVDSYHGLIVVSDGREEFQIPVTLVVGSR